LGRFGPQDIFLPFFLLNRTRVEKLSTIHLQNSGDDEEDEEKKEGGWPGSGGVVIGGVVAAGGVSNDGERD